MTGGTFSISNGGVFGSLFGTPIINPPQVCIIVCLSVPICCGCEFVDDLYGFAFFGLFSSTPQFSLSCNWVLYLLHGIVLFLSCGDASRSCQRIDNSCPHSVCHSGHARYQQASGRGWSQGLHRGNNNTISSLQEEQLNNTKVRPIMVVVLTYDHRLIDGREGVTFLRRIKHLVEDPARIVLDV
jgi:hypothetical protein